MTERKTSRARAPKRTRTKKRVKPKSKTKAPGKRAKPAKARATKPTKPRATKPAKPRATKPTKPVRAPLTRARVLDAALALADRSGLDALSMRALGAELGVEAMSLYKHVANKDDVLDGLVERVLAEMTLPDDALPWRAWLTERMTTARAVLLRHRFGASLVESRLAPTPARLAHHEAVLRCLRRAGFSVRHAYGAYLALDSVLYGFVMQEVAWPFAPEERSDVIDAVSPLMSPAQQPHMFEIMGFVMERTRAGHGAAANKLAGYDEDFTFCLGLVLDGLAQRLESALAHRL